MWIKLGFILVSQSSNKPHTLLCGITQELCDLLDKVRETGDFVEISFCFEDITIRLPREEVDFDRMKTLEGRQLRIIGDKLPPTEAEDIIEIVYCARGRPDENLYRKGLE